jgi:hypothetical protein
VDSALRGVRRNGVEVLPEPVTAYGLLAGGQDTTLEPHEVHVPHELLSDLDVYPLIITPDYIGADRRATVRQYPEPHRTRRSLGALEVLVIMVITLAVAIPLTVMASHAAAVGKSARPTAATQATASAPSRLAALSMGRESVAQFAAQRARIARQATQATRARLAAQRRTDRAATQLRRADRARGARILRTRRAEYRAALSRERRLARAGRVRT